MPVTFLVNRNVQGLPQLASTILGSATTTTYATVADSAQNVYTCGIYTSSSTVNIINGVQGSAPSGTTCTLPIVSQPSAYFIKYNSAGVAQYSLSIPSTAGSGAYNVILDPTGTFLYLVLNYNNGLSTNQVINTPSTAGGTVSSGWSLPGVTSANVNAIGLMKILASNGTIVFTAAIDIGSATTVGSETDFGLSVDSIGNIYLSGTYVETTGVSQAFLYNATATPGVSTISSYFLPALTAGTSTSFLVKFSATGQALFAVPILFSSTASSVSTSFNCVVDPTNTFVYAVGSYANTVAPAIYQASGFSSATTGLTLPITSAGGAGFLIKYTTAGAYVASSTIGAGTSTYLSSGSCQYYGLTVAPNGNIYVGGSYISTTALTINNTAAGSASTTVTAPIQTTTNGVGILVKYNSALVATFASVMNPAATTSTTPVIYSVAVDSSDVNVFVAIRYSGTIGLNVSNNFTSGTPGTSPVNLPATTSTFSAMSLVRYFLGNPLYQITMQNTGTVGVPLSVTIDPSNTSMYLSTSYQQSGPLLVPNINGTNAFSCVTTGAVQSGMFLKVS